MQLRQKLQQNACSFRTAISADYGDTLYTFALDCAADDRGNVTFTVTEPTPIAGITGTLSANGGELTFDDAALAFDLLAQGQVSPVSAPWLLIKTLRGGYFRSCTEDGEFLQLQIDDSYEEDALRLDIWLNDENVPVNAEIYWDGRRILTMRIEDFSFM